MVRIGSRKDFDGQTTEIIIFDFKNDGVMDNAGIVESYYEKTAY